MIFECVDRWLVVVVVPVGVVVVVVLVGRFQQHDRVAFSGSSGTGRGTEQQAAPEAPKDNPAARACS